MNTKNLLEALHSGEFPLAWPGHWVGGQYHIPKPGGEQKSSINPNSGEIIWHFTSSQAVMDDAIGMAKDFLKDIPHWTFDQRIEHLIKFKNSFTDFRALFQIALQVENGKPTWEANADLDAAYQYLEKVIANRSQLVEGLLASAKLGQSSDFRLHPIGICAAYLPFSTPLTSFITYYCAALIAGCPFILFTSIQASLVGLVVSFIDQQIASPRGSLGVIFSNFDQFKYALSKHDIAAVLYTGSHEHCSEIYRDYKGPYHRQLVLQSGGKNSLILDKSANLEKAVQATLYGLCKSAGQMCSSTSQVFVHQSLMPSYSERLKKAVDGMKIGRTDLPGADPFMGPLYSKKAVEKFLRYQTMANREAAETIIWGRVIEDESTKKGFFVTPGIHIMEGFDATSAYQGNVLFCPDLALYGYDKLEDAITWANNTQATYSVGFFGDEAIAKAHSAQFQAPNLMINQPTVETEVCLPLAGRTQYGRHRYQGMGLAWYLSYPQSIGGK